MLERLLDIVICPACLPGEHPLQLKAERTSGDDIIEGELGCPACGAAYPIREGLAELVPPTTPIPAVQGRYDQQRVVASYLWSHFADLWGDPQATGAYASWAELIPGMAPASGLDDGFAQVASIDAGCVTGAGIDAALVAGVGFDARSVRGAGFDVRSGPGAGFGSRSGRGTGHDVGSGRHVALKAGCQPGIGLDAGCAVGRFTLELAARLGFAVGVDLSKSFTSLARKLAREGRMAFDAPSEGHLHTRFTIELPDRLRANPVEFVTADVQALPFKKSSFAAVASLNIVDKVPRPLAHLRQCQRVLAGPGALLFSDPFSWSEEVAPPEFWLGGAKETGPALENIVRLLSDSPGWHARAGEPVWWTIRDHANRYELIRSQVVLAERDS